MTSQMIDNNQRLVFYTFRDTLNELGISEEQFFDIIRDTPDIMKMDDLIQMLSDGAFDVQSPKQWMLSPRDSDLEAENTAYPEIMKLFRQHNGIVHSHDLKDVSSYKLSRLIDQAKIVKVGRSYYALADVIATVPEITEATLLVPKGVLCLYSALARHELTAYTPDEYNFAMPRGTRKPVLPDYPPIRIFTFDKETFEMGIETVVKEENKVEMQVYDQERTICDVVKYRNKLDAEIVKESLSNYFSSRNKKRDFKKLLDYASKIRVKAHIKKYLEVMQDGH